MTVLTLQLVETCKAWITSPTVLAAVVVALSALWLCLGCSSKIPGPRFLIPLLGDTAAVRRDPLSYFLWGYLRYGAVYRTQMLGMTIYAAVEPSAVRELLRNPNNSTTFAVPFNTFNILLDDWTHMVDGQLHDYWRRAGDLALDFAIEVLVGLPLRFTDRQWLKQQLLTYFAGLYVLPWPIPGSTFKRACTAKAAIIEALSKELQDHVSLLLHQEPSAGEAVQAVMALGRLDGAAKANVLESCALFQLEPAALASSLQRLKLQDGVQQLTSASQTAAAETAPSMVDVQLEVLRAQKGVSTPAAAMRVLGSFIGAVDTTRYMIFSVLAILCQLDNEVEKLHAEQQKVVNEHGLQLTSAALADMVYLEAVLKEAMRLLPAARVGMRQAITDMTLSGVQIPKGSYIIWSIDAAHALDPTLWQGPDSIPAGAAVPRYMDWRHNLPEAFQPGRWLKPASERPKCFFTFGLGLGMGLVFTEVKLLLALLLRGNYKWAFQDPDVLRKAAVFPGLKPVPGTDKLIITKKGTG
eukprot:gene8535-8717_t